MMIHTRAVPSSPPSDKPILQKGDLSSRNAQLSGSHRQSLAQAPRPAPNTLVSKEDSSGGVRAPSAAAKHHFEGAETLEGRAGLGRGF